MKSAAKRCIALLLSLMITISMMPATVFAVESQEEEANRTELAVENADEATEATEQDTIETDTSPEETEESGDVQTAIPISPEEEETSEEPNPDKEYSYRLLVGFSGKVNPREGDIVLGSLDDVLLFGFDSAKALKEAKTYYENNAEFASVDGEFNASAEESAQTDVDSAKASANAEAASINENPISEAAETDAKSVSGKVIALVDTGVDGSYAAERLSVLGGNGSDDNGHGSELAKIISEENSKAKIVSIKALDGNGRGTVASVYAGIMLASETGADVIALPFSARGTSAAIESAVSDATAKGAVVLAAAGNDADDAVNYCPANADDSVAVGALDEEGNIADFSNKGATVKTWAKAESTSEATAKVAAGITGDKSLEDYAMDNEGEQEAAKPEEEAEEFETAYNTTSDTLVDGGVYIIRLRKDPKKSIVQQNSGYTDGNKFVLSNGDKREDSSGQFKLQKINYNYYFKLRDNTNYIMSPEGGAGSLGTNGQKVHMWYKSSSNYQDFDQWWMKTVEDGGKKYYRITNGKNTGMHLQTEGAGTAGNTALHLWNATSGTQGDWIFERCHYYVTFNGNGNTGGSMSKQKIWQEVSTALTSNAFSKTGYTFNGWNTNSSGTGTNYSNSQKVTCLSSTNAANVNLYAKWKANTYTVSYNGNGNTGGSTASSSHTYNTAKNLTANGFTRTGYTFNGWNTKSDGTGTSYANSASVKNLTSTSGGTVTLYAQWKANTYTVSYNGNGNTGGSTASSSHTYDTAKNLTANGFTRTGYTFSGWNTKSDGSGTSYADSTSVKNLTATNGGTVTLYAKWTANTYTVFMDAKGGKLSGAGINKTTNEKETATATYNTAFTLHHPVREGYEFTGWTITGMESGIQHEIGTETSTAASADNVMVLVFKNLRATSGTVTFKANWKAIKYTVRFDANGGSLAEGTENPLIVEYDESFTVGAAARLGYVFTGWKITGMEGTSHEIGGTEVTDTTYTYTTEDESAEVEFKNLRAISGEAEITAVWADAEYEVKYNLAGGNHDDVTDGQIKTYKYTESIHLSHPSRPGYKFTGWTVSGMDAGTEHNVGGTKTSAAEITAVKGTSFGKLSATGAGKREGSEPVSITATWEADDVTVALVAPDADETSEHTTSINFKYETDKFYKDAEHTKALESPIAIPVRKNFNFTGYYSNSDADGTAVIGADGTIPEGFSGMYSSAANLYAGWDAKVYTITLKQDDATTAGSESVYEKYNEGIYSDSAATAETEEVTIPEKKISFKFNANADGEAADPETITKDAAFLGFFDGETALIGPSGMLQAAFSANYFESNSTIEAKWDGVTVTLPDLEREGYTLSGWYTEATGGEKVGVAGDIYAAESNKTLYAHWIEDPALKYDGNGSTSGSTADGQIARGKTLIPAENGYEKTGYSFTCWNTLADGNGADYESGVAAVWNENLPADKDYFTLYAQWEKNELKQIKAISDHKYTGSAITPSITVIDKNGKTVDASEYELTWTDNTDVGEATVTVTAKSSGNYAYSDSVSAKFNIVKADAEYFDLAETNYSGIYDGSEHAVKATAKTEDAGHAYKIGYGATEAEAEAAAESATQGTTNAGYSVKDVADTAVIYYYIIPKNYEAFGGTLNAAITAKELSVSGLKAASRVYDGTKSATLDKSEAKLIGVEGEDAVTLDISDAEAESTAKSAGTHKVNINGLKIDGKDAGNYTLNHALDVHIEITKKPVRIDWQEGSFEYDGSPYIYELASVKAADIVGEDDVVIGTFSNNVKTHVGTYTAKLESLEGDDSANYSIDSATAENNWEITKTNNSVTVDMYGWTYGKHEHAPHSVAKYGTDTVVYTYSSDGGNTWSSAVPKNAGDHIVKATVPATEDYNEASATKEFNIAPADIIVMAHDAQSMRGEELATDIDFEIDGDFHEEDRESFEALIKVSTDAKKDVAGWYDTVAAWKNTSETDSNYNVSFHKGIYTVTRSNSKVVATGYNGKYDGQAHGISVEVTQPVGTPEDDSAKIFYTDTEHGFDATIESDLLALKDIKDENEYKTAYNKLERDLTSRYPTESPTMTNAGSKVVEFIVLSSQTNPDVILDEAIIDIVPADLTVTAKDHSITYGDAASNNGVTYYGFVYDEDEGVLGGALSYDYEAYEAGSEVGHYAITPAGLTASNYDIDFEPGTLTVNPKVVEFTWSSPSVFYYNGTERKVSATVSNSFGDDVLVVEYDDNVKTAFGKYTAVIKTLGGAKAVNYTLTGSKTAELEWEIIEMDNSVSVTIDDWTYGDSASVPVVTTAAEIDEDKAVLTYYKDADCSTKTTTADGAASEGGVPENAGTYYVKATLAGTDTYEGSEDVAGFEIAKREITVQADNKVSTYGESLKQLTYQMSGSAAHGDDLEIELSTEATSASKAGNYEIAVSHTDNANYSITATNGIYTITKAKMGVSAEGYVGDYDGKSHGISVMLDPSEEGKATVYYGAEQLTEDNFKTAGTTNAKADEVTRKNAGTTTVYYYIDSEYYDGEPAIAGSVDVVINKLPLTVAAEDSEITYGDDAENSGVFYDGFIKGESESDLDGSLAYSYKIGSKEYAPGREAGSVGSYDIIPSGLSSDNYEISYVNGVMNVKALGAEFEWDETVFTYNSSAQGPTATVKNALDGDEVNVTLYSGNEKTEVGAYVAQAEAIGGADAANYSILASEKSDSHSWKIVKADNEWINEPELAEWTYGKYDAEANAPSSKARFGNDSVVYQYKKDGLLHLLDPYTDTVPTEAGEYILLATIPGTNNYKELTGTFKFKIDKADITITADDKSSMYRSDIVELTATVTGDYVDGDELGIVLETDATKLSDVGEYETRVDWDKNPNYNATLVKGKYTVTKGYLTIEAKDTEYEYDGEPHGIDVKVTKPDINDAVIWYSNEEITSENFATVDKTEDPTDDSIAQTEAGNKTIYYFVVSENFGKNPEEGDALAGSKIVTVTPDDLEVSILDQNITYGDEPGDGAAANKADGVTYTIPTGCSDDLDFSNMVYSYDYAKYGDVGTYDISADGIASNNYNITYKTGNLNVAKYTLDFTWQNESGSDESFVYEYDGAEHRVVAVPNTLNNDELGTLTYENAKASKVGVYTAKVIALPQTGKGINYTFDSDADSSSQEWDIEKADITITADDKTGSYGDDPVALTYQITSGTLVSGDTLKINLTTDADSTVGVGDYDITPSWEEESDSYNATFVKGTYTVDQRVAELSWTDTALTYNGSEQHPNATVSNLVNGDECGIIVDGGQTDANASGETYTANAAGLTGEDAGNYKLPDKYSVEFTIAPKSIAQDMLSVDQDVFEGDGTEQGPTITMSDGTVLKEGTDYTLSGDVVSTENGTHFITITGMGNYTGSIETSWCMYGDKEESDKEEGGEVKGDIDIFVDIEDATEKVKIENFNLDFAKSLLDEEDKERNSSGEDVTVYVEVIEEESEEAENNDRELLMQKFNERSAQDIRWFDIKVWKKIGTDAALSIHELGSELDMSINVPEEYRDAPSGYSRTYYFGRAHEGKAEIISETKDKVISFGSSEFSTYAMAYSDKRNEDPNQLLLAQMKAKGKKSMVITWTRVNGADGYDIYMSGCNCRGKAYTPKLVKSVRGNGTFKWTKKKLKAKKAYKAYVCAYKIIGGRKQYISRSLMIHGYTSGYKGKYTDAKSVSVNRSAVSLSEGGTFGIAARIKKVKAKKVLIKTSHAPRLRYVTSNSTVAAVSGSGVIVARGSGTCYVYAVATNGVRAAVRVTVN